MVFENNFYGMKMSESIFSVIMRIVFILFLMVLAIMILWNLIFGGSDPLFVGLLLANLTYSWYINKQLQRHLGYHEGYQQGIKNGKK